jgi:hypothetical protein
MRRNKIAELVQEREAAARWLVRCGFIHPLPCGRFTRGKPTLFYPSTIKTVGLLWIWFKRGRMKFYSLARLRNSFAKSALFFFFSATSIIAE